MSEPRLIDANEIVEVAERAWNAWNLAMATQDTNQGINKVLKRQELCKAVKRGEMNRRYNNKQKSQSFS